MPWALWVHLASDPELCRAVASAFVGAVFASYRRRARAQDLLLTPRSFAHPGAVNFLQRFGSSLALNVHFHALLLDGVFVTHGPASVPVFHTAPPLEDAEVERVQRDARSRIERIHLARGLLRDPGDEPAPVKGEDESLLPFLCAASLQSRTASGPDSGRALERLVDPHLSREASDPARFAPGSLRAESDGYSLHAATCIPAADREALEHLCRYVTRPPLAQGRLLLRDDGKVIWNLRKPWRDGTRGFVLDPLVFIERLVALIPHPREHQLTYHGVLASASPLRDDVVPLPPSRRARPGDPTHSPPPTPAARKRFSWAESLRRVFATDVLQCPREPKAAATSSPSSPIRRSSAASSPT